jgi:hypothetical protein
MARQISPQRKKVAVLAGAVAAISGCVSILRNHPYFEGIVLICMVGALAYLIREMVKLKRVERCG